MTEERSLWTRTPQFQDQTKSFASPQVLWQLALEYFRWCDSNPMYKVEQLKKPGQPIILDDGRVIPGECLVEIPIRRPYTFKGLCIFLGVNSDYFSTFKYKHSHGVFQNPSKEWMDTIKRIDDIIFNQQYEGAVAGVYNPIIVSRMLGLAEKTEIESTKVTEVEVFKIGDKVFQLGGQ